MHPEPGLRRRLLVVLAAVATAYALYGAMLYALQRAMLYPGAGTPGEPNAGAGVPGLERHWLEGDFGRVELWVLPALPSDDEREGRARPEVPDDAASRRPTVLFTHGNGELIDYWAEPFEGLRGRGYNVALLEYPGYGRSIGEPGQATITASTLAAYDLLAARPDVDPRAVFALGRSLGGGPACALALQRPLAGLALQSTFRSVREMARQFFLPGFLVRDPWDNLAAVRSLDVPVIVFHGTHDEVIPYSHGASLAEAARHGRLVTQTGGHNDVPPSFEEFFDAFDAWAQRATPPSGTP